MLIWRALNSSIAPSFPILLPNKLNKKVLVKRQHTHIYKYILLLYCANRSIWSQSRGQRASSFVPDIIASQTINNKTLIKGSKYKLFCIRIDGTSILQSLTKKWKSLLLLQLLNRSICHQSRGDRCDSFESDIIIRYAVQKFNNKDWLIWSYDK